jgi:hypothetical protein
MFRLPRVVNLFWLMWYRAIVDARLAFTILQGFTITFGFANQDELKGWITMKLPNSDRLKEKVASMTTEKIGMNFEFKDPDLPPRDQK